MRRREFDLWPLVQGLVYDLRPLAASAGTRLVNSVPEDLAVFADAPALSQVFQNLLSNAIRYAPGGRVTVTARRPEGGTGLGLATVRQVVEAHRGQVRTRSCPGGGTSFLFDIPDSRGELDRTEPTAGAR